MTTARYVKDILQPTLLIYVDGHPRAYFQQDNARPHFAHRTINFFRKIGIMERRLSTLYHRHIHWQFKLLERRCHTSY